MSTVTKSIEKRWIKNFYKCALVDRQTNEYNYKLAKYLFYGEDELSEFQGQIGNFFQFYSTFDDFNLDKCVDGIISFLHFVGIDIQKHYILNHLGHVPNDLIRIAQKTHNILQELAHRKSANQLENPFLDNISDINFLLKVESQEAILGGQLNIFDDDAPLPELYKRNSFIPEGYEDDPVISELYDKINNTNESYFITGKAGTGKSTFINFFAQKTKKKIVLLSFTGIAAVNVGGSTIHSFFRLPFKPLVPEDDEIKIFGNGTEKRKMIESIDTIIIDEVSMLRIDVLEAIDYSLRKNGGNEQLCFGGKQMILVGDIFQLPPVVNDKDEAEKIVFTQHYLSKYFFDAPAYNILKPTFFEFNKIHRQKNDLKFVNLLNSIREYKQTNEVLNELNNCVDPYFQAPEKEFWITLTSSRWLADNENSRKLNMLNTTKYIFNAEVVGDFPEDRLPTNSILELRKNAQVIFVKNDMSRRWVNGTIAKVSFVAENHIEVALQDGSIHKIFKETWENRRLKYDSELRKVTSSNVGKFVQYPIKLAWAITIHKSQGLTIDNIIIDTGYGAFVNGQIYTALSRCKTLNGIKLKKAIRHEDIKMDYRLTEFYTSQYSN